MSCKPTPRFEAVLAPDDRWMIFDLIDGLPVEMGGQVLIGLDRRAALDLERRLNRGGYQSDSAAVSSGRDRPY
ncbi:hypothetical protein GCM10010862_23660 [Devosia nitrariae]|uniref:Uncharacterized protein n=1 Tax=Devosia nitrariae TaxID=2071872 RepID=A0ABQ5W547_9HYPH|nr:hypothetical protein GCM10010862_23660 [Devosia nitrariae]